jgi:L-idonate 5-dehydrogenase
MLAAVLHGAHDLRVEALPDLAQGPGEVLVRVAVGGICGSDLSYFHKFRVGDFPVLEPLTLGHEVAGTVEALGDGVASVAVGQNVAINPSRPCRHCDYCRAGRSNLCRHMRFLGSAAIMPHVQGAFREHIVLREDQCVPIPQGMSLRVAACAEPLSVALHGLRRAGDLFGKRVLITGAGPIGQLCLIAARAAGAAELVITDLADEPLAIARAAGATETINVATSADQVARFEANKGHFDVMFEATGVPEALSAALRTVAPGGRVVQLGLLPAGSVPLAVNLLVTKEIELVGSFRFHEEFATAVAALASGLIDVSPILSAELPLADATAAFELASDRRRAIKVHLVIG